MALRTWGRRAPVWLAPLAALAAACGASAGESGEQTVTEQPTVDAGGDAVTTHEAAAPDAPASTCIDHDGDGFGDGCFAGPDCDDSDPNVTDGCQRCPRPGIPGCPCAAEEAGTKVPCGQIDSDAGGVLTCGPGESTCSAGRWGTCIINNTSQLDGGS